MALDTKTGQLCKTYPWDDNQGAPRGLPLCSQLAGTAASKSPFDDALDKAFGPAPVSPTGLSLIGAQKAYRGFTYTFDGTKWNKGSEAQQYNPATGKLEPLSDDQYDPLNLFTRDQKAKKVLTEAQIRRVANEFGVSYTEASEDAKAQGYQVPARK